MKTFLAFAFFIILTIFQHKNTNHNMDTVVTPILEIKATLGEGALWDYKNNQLLWVDIEEGILYVYDPATGKNIAHEQGKRIGTVVPIDTGGMVTALQDGIYTYNPNNGELIKKASPEEDKPQNRFNDGKCDPGGRFWAGTMALKGGRGSGALYRIDHDFSYKKMIDNVSTSNGIVWSLDNTKMYYIDTPTRKVVAYDYDNGTGDISSPRTAIEIPAELGSPDGSTLDAEGMIWIAMWGGASVTRWNPETGELLQKISVPALNVTSCAFGGKDLDILYITSASMSMNESQKEQYPYAGKLFQVKPGVKGIKANYFKTR
jgi:sugar lactone lactonase YvrE